eukprot:3688345-Prymnesium_polylepis.1
MYTALEPCTALRPRSVCAGADGFCVRERARWAHVLVVEAEPDEVEDHLVAGPAVRQDASTEAT